MKYILKNAETSHVEDLYGYYDFWMNENFMEVVPTGNNGIYTDKKYNRKFFGTGLYYMETDPSTYREIGYRLLHKTDAQVVFPISKWTPQTGQIVEFVTGTSVVECDLDGNETSMVYYLYENEYDELCLYYRENPGQQYCQYKTRARDLKLLKPISECDYITSIVPGVTYNEPVVAYNGKVTDVVVRCATVGGEPIITAFTIPTHFCYFKQEDVEEWYNEANQVIPFPSTRIYCYDEEGVLIPGPGHNDSFGNGFYIPGGTKEIVFEFYHEPEE